MSKNITVIIVISYITIFLISCREKNTRDICFKYGFAEEIIFNDLNYKPLKWTVLLYETKSNFKTFINTKESYIYKKEDGEEIGLYFLDHSKFSLEYDYRLVIDDTLCFDLSKFVTVPDTMGKTMGGWAIRCQLVSYSCNDSIYYTNISRLIDLPFEAGRMIKKDQYDQ